MATKKRQGTADRLREVMRDRNWTVERFAHEIGSGGRTTVVPWLKEGKDPGGKFLRAIAEKTEVTVGWLLCIDGEPKFRDQVRPLDDLESDIAAYVTREVRLAALASTAPADVALRLRAPGWRADGADVLKHAVNTAIERIRSQHLVFDQAEEIRRLSLLLAKERDTQTGPIPGGPD